VEPEVQPHGRDAGTTALARSPSRSRVRSSAQLGLGNLQEHPI
jgi:hypothetical protein